MPATSVVFLLVLCLWLVCCLGRCAFPGVRCPVLVRVVTLTFGGACGGGEIFCLGYRECGVKFVSSGRLQCGISIFFLEEGKHGIKLTLASSVLRCRASAPRVPVCKHSQSPAVKAPCCRGSPRHLLGKRSPCQDEATGCFFPCRFLFRAVARFGSFGLCFVNCVGYSPAAHRPSPDGFSSYRLKGSNAPFFCVSIGKSLLCRLDVFASFRIFPPFRCLISCRRAAALRFASAFL